MAQNFDRPEYRDVRQSDLSGGVNDYLNQNVIKPTETPDALNVDFDRASVDTAFGSIKFNNQTAPSACIRTKSLKGQQPLAVLSAPLQRKGVPPGPPFTLDTRNIEVPMRGYAYLPYATETDIGGNFVEGATDALTTTPIRDQLQFHRRQGRSFELNVSFRLPEHEKLFDVEVKGSAAPAAPALPLLPPNGFDEALDETFIVIQKGGDRLAPMSWALGVTNIGTGYGLKQSPQPRPSNYALVFMWYDNAQWGNVDGTKLKYNLTSGQDLTGGATQNATMAYRAVVIHRYIEPGVNYHVAVQLQLDTGAPAYFVGNPGGTGTNVAGTWDANGYFRVHVADDQGNFTTHNYTDTASPTQAGLEVCRGPVDSLSYLCRYGIRFSGRDAMFLGLGMRFSPWDHAGFIPFGHDSACMRSGGMALIDRSNVDLNALFGAPGPNAINASHVSSNAYLTLSVANMGTFQLIGSRDPMALADTTVANQYAQWTGLQNNFNALRGYRLVASNNVTAGPGARLTLLDRDTVNADRINFLDGADTSKFGAFGSVIQNFTVQCFRWNQRDLDIANVRIWSAPRDYTTTLAPFTIVGVGQSYSGVFDPVVARRRKALGMSLALEDETEPDVANLIAYWPCDDSGGALLREKVVGGLRHGFLCPMQNAVSDAGQRGENMLFMSGEGESLTLDLSENETFLAQLATMLRQPDQGFGFEISFVPTEAFYGVYTQEAPGNLSSVIGTRPVGAPDLIAWDVKDPTAGRSSRARQLLSLSHRAILRENDNTPCEFAQGFGVEVAAWSDSEDYSPVQPHALAPWYLQAGGTLAMTNRYDKYAGWVGKRITIQVGIQSFDPATDSYNVYIAMAPKSVLRPVAGDPDDVEFSYWTDTEANSSGGTYASDLFDGPQMRIARKDIERTVLTIGGRWDCKTLPTASKALGINEVSARMLVDEVRWFATTPAGALSPTTGAAITARNGKLQGANCLPQRLLTDADLKGSLGTGASTVTVTQGSRSVTVTSTSLANGQAPATSQQSVLGSYLYVDGDTRPLSVEETLSEPVKDFYYIDAVSANTAVLTLGSAYRGGSKSLAAASAFRVVGYTAFEDDISDQKLYLGKGKGYDPSSATIDDVVLTQGYWANRAITGGEWSLRIYNPFSIVTLEQASPDWSRGIVNERRFKDDGILGLHAYNERIYAGVRGSLYEVDDRWRDDGPTDELSSSLMFKSARLASNAVLPLHADRVEFTTVAAAYFAASPDDAYATVFENWAKLTKIDEYQGVMWFGGTNLPLDQGAWRTLVLSTAGTTTYSSTSVTDSAWVVPATVVPGVWVRTGTTYGQVTSVSGTTINVSGWVSAAGAAVTPTNGIQAEVFVPGHRTVYQTLYSRGRPQIAFGSSGAIGVGVYPEKGLFIATADITVQAQEWHHVRWVVPSTGSGAWLQVPRCYINGKRVTVTVNASESGATGTQWISTANIVSPFGNIRVALGALRDAYTVSDPPQLNFRKDLIVMSPARHVGWLHSLDGLLSQTIVTRQPWTGTDYVNFNPYAINYNAPGLIAQFNALSTELGVGHKVRNDAGPVSGGGPIIYGTILSHPFISLWHASGGYTNQWTFAENGAQVYATNGGRPVVAIDVDSNATPVAVESGVPAPTTELDFTTTRYPLWRLESQSQTEQRDPLKSGKDVYGLSTIGNSYLQQELGTAMAWTTGSIFHFKLLYTPKDVAGRISLFRRGTDANNGGPFVECVDGKIRYGWYDLALKKAVWIESDSAVIEPGKLTYIYIRHRYPEQDKVWGNWRNSYFANGHYRRFVGTLGTTGQTLKASQVVYGWTGAANAGQYQIVKVWQEGTTSGDDVVIDAVRINDTDVNLNSTNTLRTAVGGGGTLLVNCTYAARPMHDMFVVQQFGNSRATWGGGATGTAESPSPHTPLEVIHASGVVTGGVATGFDWTQATYSSRTASELAEQRTYWSLTTDEYPRGTSAPSGVSADSRFKATGLASVPWLQFVRASSTEFVLSTTSIAGFGAFPWLQCIGAVFEILDDSSSTASIRGRQFIITECEDVGGVAADRLKRIVVTNLDGSAPSLPALAVGRGAVFIGKALVKSADFDNSTQVDDTQKEIQLFGCQDNATFQPFDGVVHSFGFGVASPNATTDKADMFEARNTSATNTAYATNTTEDGMFVGADQWSYPINSQPVSVGAGGANFPVETLKFTASLQYLQVNGSTYAASATYATTHPNTQLEVANTSTVASTGGVESKGKWRFLQAVTDWLGKRYVAVGFYDPVQGIAGNPGPVLEIKPAGNDAANDAGPVSINITNIPAGPDGSEVWIYCSPAESNAATLYRVARLVNGTNGYQISTPEDQIVTGPPAEFSNFRPPQCEIVAPSKGSMLYGALQVQPDAIVPSRPASPGQVDFTRLFRLQGGTGEKITGMIEFDGLLVATKRRLVASIDFVGGNYAVPDIVSTGVGCVSPNTLVAKDNVLMFLSDRGLQATTRRGVTNLNSPEYIGDNISTFVQDSVDRRYLSKAYAAVNRKRSQYTCVLRTKGEDHQNYRFTCDLTAEGPIYSLYRLPNLTAVAAARKRDGAEEILVGGTEEGFVVYLDRPDATEAVMGDITGIWGLPLVQNYLTTTTNAFFVSYAQQVDTALEGSRGVTATYVDQDGALREVNLLGYANQWMLFAEQPPVPIPANVNVAFGQQDTHYETAWLDFGNAERRKLLYYVNLVFGREQAGEVVVRVYTDWDSDNPKAEATLDLTQAEQEVSLGGVDGNWFKLSLDSVDVQPGLRFTLSSIIWRLDDTDQV